MNELITDINTAVLVFHDGSNKYITQNQYEALIGQYTNPNLQKIEIGGSLYSKSAISKILTLEEFYEEYPTKKPELKGINEISNLYEYDPSKDLRSEKLANKGLEQLLKGLGRYIAEEAAKGNKTPKAIAMYEQYEKKLNAQKKI